MQNIDYFITLAVIHLNTSLDFNQLDEKKFTLSDNLISNLNFKKFDLFRMDEGKTDCVCLNVFFLLQCVIHIIVYR